MDRPDYAAAHSPARAVSAVRAAFARARNVALTAAIALILVAAVVASVSADPCTQCKENYRKKTDADTQIVTKGCVAAGFGLLLAWLTAPAAGLGAMTYCNVGVASYLGGAIDKALDIHSDANTSCAQVCSGNQPVKGPGSLDPWLPKATTPERKPPPVGATRPRQTHDQQWSRSGHSLRTSQAQTSPDVLYGDPAPPQAQQHDPAITQVLISGGILIDALRNRLRGPTGAPQGGGRNCHHKPNRSTIDCGSN